MKTIGTVLLVIGLAMTVFTGCRLTKREEIVDLGSITISKDKQIPIFWSPLIGGGLMAAGVLVLLLGGNTRKV
jgi:hypothetical protein